MATLNRSYRTAKLCPSSIPHMHYHYERYANWEDPGYYGRLGNSCLRRQRVESARKRQDNEWSDTALSELMAGWNTNTFRMRREALYESGSEEELMFGNRVPYMTIVP